MAQNPWAVDSIKAFYFLKCPECDFDTKEENSFENHATENHPQSFVLFDKKCVVKDFDTIDIKEEPLSHFDMQNSYEGQKPSMHNPFSQLSPITEENSMFVVPEVKGEPTDKSYTENTKLRDINNWEMENCSNDGAIIGNNPGEDPLKMSVHEEKKQYECIICNESFGRKFDMKKHIESVHEGKKPFKCTICKSCYTRKIALKKHIKTVHENVTQFYPLPVHTIPIGVNNISRKAQDIFRESLKFDSAIETHSMNIAGTPEKKEKSAKIEVKLLKMDPSDDKSDMKKHIESVHEEKNKHICNICNKGFAEKAKLIAHNASFHEGKKPHSCPTCEASFDYSASLKKHIATVHDGQKQHSCYICGFSFTEVSNLKEHIEDIHNRKTPYECSICNEAFSFKTERKNHIASIHGGNKCSVCFKSFVKYGQLQRHISLVHEGIKPFECSICERKFSTKCGLNKHIRKEHSGYTKDTENIDKQEFSEFKEEPDIGVDEEDIDNKNIAGIGDIKTEPIDSTIYVE